MEDHSLIGGFGSAVIEEAVRRGLDTTLITSLGLPDRFIGHGSRKEQLEEAGIDTHAIATTASKILQSTPCESPAVLTT